MIFLLTALIMQANAQVLATVGTTKITVEDFNRRMEDVRKDQLDKLHSPIFYVTGDKTDIAYENGADDFKRITMVPAIHTYKDGVGHGGTYSQPNGGDFARVAVAMLKWQLKGEKEQSKMFVGANCGLCQEAGWHVATKGIK